MSPLWRNRIYIAISPERISLLKLGRGLKPKLLANVNEVVSPLDKQPVWQAALDRLAQVLAQPEWQVAEAEVVLSNSLVRYALIPISGELKKYPEQEAFARHVLSRTYGEVVSQWELRIQPGVLDAPWLVSAVDQSFLARLRQVCAEQQLKLRTVTPYLMQVFNRHGHNFQNDPAWLVVNEPEGSLIALMRNGEFVAINVVLHDSISKLPMLLDRENLIAGLAEPCKSVYLHTSSNEDMSFLLENGYQLNRLEREEANDFPMLAEGLYDMAYSGVK